MADKQDAIALLKADHRKVEELFEQFEGAKGDLQLLRDSFFTKWLRRTPLGLRCGAFVATGVLLWFGIGDAMHGVAFKSLSLFGFALMQIAGVDGTDIPSVVAASVYLLFHFAAFTAFGFLVEGVLRAARREPTLLAGILLGVVVAEAIFAAVVMVIGIAFLTVGSRAGAVTMHQLLPGNLVGCALTVIWLWRYHPELRGRSGRIFAENGLIGTEKQPTSPIA